MKTIYFTISSNPSKKYTVKIDNKTISFGARGYSDYTKHKDSQRKQRYINRHKVRENWTKSGITTPGFWSRWILWNKPTLKESIENTEKRFGIRIIRKKF